MGTESSLISPQVLLIQVAAVIFDKLCKMHQNRYLLTGSPDNRSQPKGRRINGALRR